MAEITLRRPGTGPGRLRSAGTELLERLHASGRRARALWTGFSWPATAAVLTGLIALLVLIGWASGSDVLRTPIQGWAAMTPNAAVGMLLCAASLWLLRRPAISRRQLVLGRGLAVLAIVIGACTLIEILYTVDMHVDGLLLGAGAAAGRPARMAPSVAAALVLMGLALLLLDTETVGHRWPAEFLAIAVLLMAVPRLVGYAYAVVPRVADPRAMGPYDTLALILLATGLLASRTDRGMVCILASHSEGGRMARQLVPAALVVPLVLGALAVAAAASGLISPLYAAPMAVSGVIICFVGLGLVAAWQARHAELRRESTTQRLQAQHDATRALIESTTVAEASPRFLQSIGESLAWDVALLWQVNREAGVLECAYTWQRGGGDGDLAGVEQAARRMRLAPGVDLPGLVWTTGQPAWVPDLQRSPSLRGATAATAGLRSGFAFPIRYGPEVRGVIELFGRHARDPDREALAIAPILGRQIGEALERKRAEERLRASEDRFRAVAESAIDALVTVDGSDRISYLNAAAERMFGYRAADIAGSRLSLLLPGIGAVDERLVGRTVEQRARRFDGSELPVELSAARWTTAEGVYSTAIIRDVSARKQAEEQLRLARDAAEASSHELEAFSYSVSHDLRTPVRSIDGFSQALLEDFGDRLGDEGKENILRVRRAAQRMSQLIDDLLELSRTSRTQLHHQEVDLSAMAAEVVDELRAAQPGRQVEVVIAGRVMAWGDARLLRVVLQNLLDNAWKYTGRQPEARIELGELPGTSPSVYFVRDNGVGFDVAFAQRLFEPFQRLHDSDDYPGSGVGLALVQRIVSRHGGRIWAESTLGQGATFYFSLPRPEAAP
jgi:PAS domain S-box-containing protein